MPRFHTRLFVVDQPDGTVRVLYERDIPPDAKRAMPLNFIGPRPVAPPERPLRSDELDRWKWELASGEFSMQFYARQALGLPAVEELEDDSPPPGASVFATASLWEEPGRPASLLIRVSNTGDVAVSGVTVHWCFTNETPQPHLLGAVRAEMVGGDLSLASESGFDGVLEVGESRDFLLDHRATISVRSQIAALSPERYGVSIRSRGHEVGRLPGESIAEVFDSETAE